MFCISDDLYQLHPSRVLYLTRMGLWDPIPVHQGLSLLKRHRRASAAAATALFAMLLTLLPRVILSFMLGMIVSPVLIAVTVVSPQASISD